MARSVLNRWRRPCVRSVLVGHDEECVVASHCGGCPNAGAGAEVYSCAHGSCRLCAEQDVDGDVEAGRLRAEIDRLRVEYDAALRGARTRAEVAIAERNRLRLEVQGWRDEVARLRDELRGKR